MVDRDSGSEGTANCDLAGAMTRSWQCGDALSDALGGASSGTSPSGVDVQVPSSKPRQRYSYSSYRPCFSAPNLSVGEELEGRVEGRVL